MQPIEGEPPIGKVRASLIAAGRRYWLGAEDLLAALAQETPAAQDDADFCGFVDVELPDWAADIGVGSPSSLLVDARALRPGESAPFERCDWWYAAAVMLWSERERSLEKHQGPSHSYAFRVGIDPRVFDRAWVNRILLLLRRQAARRVGRSEIEIFGNKRPAANLILTFDLDAVTRRLELRFKQAAFHALNFGRLLSRGQPRAGLARTLAACRSLTAGDDLWVMDGLFRQLDDAGVKARMHVYAGPSGGARDAKGMLMDPGYDVAEPRLSSALRTFLQHGHEVGLHPSFASWHLPDAIRKQRLALERVVDVPVLACRQHWLRFSYAQTWRAQAAAGVRLDSTLGFNDRPGFRNAAALTFVPTDPTDMSSISIDVQTMILMDSHLYDYDLAAAGAVEASIDRWCDEVKAVGGEATVLWHPHTLHPSIGWKAGFEHLLFRVAGMQEG